MVAAQYSSIVRAALVLLSAAGLPACATSGWGTAPLVPAGSTVELRQALDVPPGGARVHIQGGRVIAEGDIDRFVPHCSFGLRRQAGDASLAGLIQPGRFDTGRSRSRGQAAAPEREPVRVASRDWSWLASKRRPGGGIVHLTFRTEIPLHAAGQPQVDDLTCSYDAEPDKGYLTLDRIRAALGDVATIRPAGG